MGETLTRGAATEIVVSGQTVIASGDYEYVSALLKARTLTADDGKRELRTIDGEPVTVNIGAIGLVRPARGKRESTFGFSRALEGGE